MGRAPRRAFGALLCLVSLLVAAAAPAQDVAPRRDPTAAERASLHTLESEVEPFLHRAASYRATLQSIVAREHTRRLDDARRHYGRQIEAEREAEAAARRQAIARFERFLAEHPEDPERTPDVMFRLAELYYDEAAWARLARDDAPADHRCATLLYRHVVARFPQYRLRDATHYLLGWVLQEMGRLDDAARAWEALACPAQRRYDADTSFDLAAPLQPVDAPLACPGLVALLRPRAPALVTPDVTAVIAPASPLDPSRCEALRGADGGPSRYEAEVWYHLGDARFDADDNPGAIAAYDAAMRAAEPRAGAPGERSPFWAKALYKRSWAHFRQPGGYVDAVRGFAQLLDHHERTGLDAAARGSRADALRWVGVIFSEGEWDPATPAPESSRCQALVEALAQPPADAPRPFDCAGILRLAAPFTADALLRAARDERPPAPPTGAGYIPQDRGWTPDAWLELASDYLLQTKHYEAITLYRLFLARFPMHLRAPDAVEHIAAAYTRQRRFEEALAARDRMQRYVEGTAWWEANRDHPDALRSAERRARDVLHDIALERHQSAAALRQQAVALTRQAQGASGAERARLQASAVEVLRRSDAAYHEAAQAYTRFVLNHPNDDDAYAFRYNRADALFWGSDPAEAARAYAEVRDANDDDRHLAAAAYMAVRAQEAAVVAQARERQIEPCDALRAGVPRASLVDDLGAPLLTDEQAASCGRSEGRPMPEAIVALQQARLLYGSRVPAALDRAEQLADVVAADAPRERAAPFHEKFAYLHARTLVAFGRGAEAEAPLRALLASCRDPVVAPAAFAELHAELSRTDRLDEIGALLREQSQGSCVTEAVPYEQGYTFRRALERYHDAERAPAAAASARFEAAARAMEDAVARAPHHHDAPLATFYAALAWERCGRSDTATQAYLRVLRDHDHTGDALTGEALTQRVTLLEQSHFRAAVNLERQLDHDAALLHYRAVVDDPRLGAATDHALHAHDALAAAALLTSQLGRHAEAERAWQRLLPAARAGDERAEVAWRLAELPYRAGDHAAAVRSLTRYLAETPADAHTAQHRVRAQHTLALALRGLGDEARYRRALREVVTVFRASGAPVGTPGAALAAEALYADLHDRVTAFERTAFTRGDAASLRAQVTRARAELAALDAAAREVVALRGGEFSIGALVGQGEAHEHLATLASRVGEFLDVADAPQHRAARAAIARLRALARRLPTQRERLTAQADALEAQLDAQQRALIDAVQSAFDGEADVERQLAVINYATAVHTARAQNLPTPFAARALERLHTDDNRRSLDAAMARQRAFPYTPGMFDAQAPGATLTQSTPEATPHVAAD
jgi:tetratricopeptide (TPR) repeat protein